MRDGNLGRGGGPRFQKPALRFRRPTLPPTRTARRGRPAVARVTADATYLEFEEFQ